MSVLSLIHIDLDVCSALFYLYSRILLISLIVENEM